jgi:release factor glutamine methyltransferase
MNIKQALEYGKASIDELDAQVILSAILKVDRFTMLLNKDKEVKALTRYKAMIERRKNHEPLAYILGYKDFYKLRFKVNKSVLIPRNDTETLIEEFSREFPQSNAPLKLLELGVGSGCIIISLLDDYKNATALGVDICQKALKVARHNAIHASTDCTLEQRLELIQSNWFNAITAGKFDCIIANPPYIASSYPLENSVINFEPKKALIAKNDGLSDYQIIASQAKAYLKDDGKIILEIGFDQEERVTKIFTSAGFTLSKKTADLGGIIRCLVFINQKR